MSDEKKQRYLVIRCWSDSPYEGSNTEIFVFDAVSESHAIAKAVQGVSNPDRSQYEAFAVNELPDDWMYQ